MYFKYIYKLVNVTLVAFCVWIWVYSLSFLLEKLLLSHWFKKRRAEKFSPLRVQRKQVSKISNIRFSWCPLWAEENALSWK